MKRDGSNPTILTAYGGFEVSLTPQYDANAGKLWVEQGGVYVVGEHSRRRRVRSRVARGGTQDTCAR